MAAEEKLATTTKLVAVSISCILSFLLLLSPWADLIDKLCYDVFFNERGKEEVQDNIIVVAIDEDSFEELDLRWPWSRALHATLISTLNNHGAKTIAFDILFAEPSTQAEDLDLCNAIARAGNVILAADYSKTWDPMYKFFKEQLVLPSPIMGCLPQGHPYGFININIDSDGFVRNTYPAQESMLSFAQAAAVMFSKQEPKNDNELVHINYAGPKRHIRTISYYQALKPDVYLPKDYFKDALVFIGFSTASAATVEDSTPDHYPTPFSRWTSELMPGVEIHANLARNFLENNFIKVIDKSISISWGLGLGFLLGILFCSLRPVYSFLVFAISAGGISFFNYTLFIENMTYLSPLNFLLPTVFCFLSSPVIHYLGAVRQKNFIKRAFSSYLAPRLVDQLISDPKKLKLGGVEAEATIFFLDMAGFTSKAETMSPQEVITYVNQSLGSYSEVILDNDGMVDKFIGDAIMAVWGVPIADKHMADKACAASLKIKEAASVDTEGKAKVPNIRIGLHSGLVVVGNVGGERQFNYTVLGSPVNLASRLEGLNKYYGTHIVVSDAIKNKTSHLFTFRELDTVKVVGQEMPVTIFELVAFKNKADVTLLNTIEHYQTGLAYYRKKDFPAALNHFNAALAANPNDEPSKVMLARAMKYLHDGTPQSWDGIFQFDLK